MIKYWPMIAVVVCWWSQVMLATIAGTGAVLPDIPLLMCTFVGVLEGSGPGLSIGLVSGLIQDLSASRYIGLNALAKASCGFASGMIGRRLFSDRLVVPFTTGFAASVLSDTLVLAVLNILGGNMPFLGRAPTIVVAAIYNGLIAPVVFAVMSSVHAKEPAIGRQV